MAKQTSLITFTGRLGNIIGYCRNGDHFLRSMPEKVRQTAATRRAAQRFGLASRKAALIRRAFVGELDISRDGGYVNRLSKTLLSAGHNLKAIAGYRFNLHTGIDRFFTIAPHCMEDGTLHIPAQELPRFDDMTALEVKIIAARINFNTHQIVSTDASLITLDLANPFTGASFPLDLPGKGMLIVTLQVRGVLDGRPAGNRKYLAADIIAVQASAITSLPRQTVYVRQRVLAPQQMVLCSPAYIALPPAFMQRE